jgi:hypothetical protein
MICEGMDEELSIIYYDEKIRELLPVLILAWQAPSRIEVHLPSARICVQEEVAL